MESTLYPCSCTLRGIFSNGFPSFKRTSSVSPSVICASLSLVRTKVIGQCSRVMSSIWFIFLFSSSYTNKVCPPWESFRKVATPRTSSTSWMKSLFPVRECASPSHRHTGGCQALGSIQQFFQCGDVVPAHHVTEYFRSQPHEIETAGRRCSQSPHHETEYPGQESPACKRASLFPLDGIQSPKGKEHVYFVTDGSRAGSSVKAAVSLSKSPLKA